MIELVAHKDNSWPGAYRLMMKDTGFLLGIGRDVTAVAEARLKEEDMEGDYRITFADGRQRVKRGSVYSAQWEEVDDPFSDPVEPKLDTPFAPPVEELWTPTAARLSGQVDRHGKPVKPAVKKAVEKFVLPKLKPIEPRATDAEKAAAKRAKRKR